MSGFRVTHRSIATTALTGLQTNISRLGDSQRELSSGKLVGKASDSPGGAVAAMQYRSDIAAQHQYARNADDGLGWLAQVDSALTDTSGYVNRARDLVLQAMSAGAAGSPEARKSIAVEVEGIREAVIGLANTKYLDRPVFGGTTNKLIAVNPDGSYAGDQGKVERRISDNLTVRVDLNGEDVFGSDTAGLFAALQSVADALNGSGIGLDTALSTALDDLDTSRKTVLKNLAEVGTRYNQVEQMRQAANDRVLDMTAQLSDVEDIDLPKTITEMSLRQTAYQAALAATARVVQPSLIDFLR
jgi:flagellar hook-associated protein 3 FlgL